LLIVVLLDDHTALIGYDTVVTRKLTVSDDTVHCGAQGRVEG